MSSSFCRRSCRSSSTGGSTECPSTSAWSSWEDCLALSSFTRASYNSLCFRRVFRDEYQGDSSKQYCFHRSSSRQNFWRRRETSCSRVMSYGVRSSCSSLSAMRDSGSEASWVYRHPRICKRISSGSSSHCAGWPSDAMSHDGGRPRLECRIHRKSLVTAQKDAKFIAGKRGRGSKPRASRRRRGVKSDIHACSIPGWCQRRVTPRVRLRSSPAKKCLDPPDPGLGPCPLGR